LYRFINDFIWTIFLSLSGLYNEKTIAEPIPNSANDRILSRLVNNPLSPK